MAKNRIIEGWHKGIKNKLCSNESTSITFNLLERICQVLECGVEDVLILEERSDS